MPALPPHPLVIYIRVALPFSLSEQSRGARRFFLEAGSMARGRHFLAEIGIDDVISSRIDRDLDNAPIQYQSNRIHEIEELFIFLVTSCPSPLS